MYKTVQPRLGLISHSLLVADAGWLPTHSHCDFFFVNKSQSHCENWLEVVKPQSQQVNSAGWDRVIVECDRHRIGTVPCIHKMITKFLFPERYLCDTRQ